MSDDKRIAELERELAALRELMNCYNLGGWTDANAAMKRALAAEAALAERTRERNNANQMVDASTGWYRACRDAEAALAERTRERDAAIRRAEALAVVLRDARAAIAPPSVVFAAGYPLPAHLRMTAERAQLLGRIDAAIDAARAEGEK